MNVSEGLHLSGKITIDVYRAGFIEAADLYLQSLKRYKELLSHRQSKDCERWLRGRVQYFTERLEAVRADYFLHTAVQCHNLIMDSSNYGLDLIIQRLVGINTYSLNILYCELGTGNTTPSLSDTGLTTPTNRAAVGFQQDYGSTDAVLQFFFSDSQLANETYKEFGTFIDGTTDIGSGQIFNLARLSPDYVKAAGTDTTCQLDVSISNA